MLFEKEIFQKKPRGKVDDVINQGLIQKEKVDIDGEKIAEISIVAKKTITQR